MQLDERKPLVLRIKKPKKKRPQPSHDNEKQNIETNEVQKSNQESAGKENLTRNTPPLYTAQQEQQTTTPKVVVAHVNGHCKHSDGYPEKHDRENPQIETEIEKVSISSIPTHQPVKKPPAKSQQKKSNRSNSKTTKLNSNTKFMQTENDQSRLAMEFPRHNWLLERLVSEKKIDGQDIKHHEMKLAEKMTQEKEQRNKENEELEKINRERRRMLRLVRVRQRQHQQQILNRRGEPLTIKPTTSPSLPESPESQTLRSKSDSEIEIKSSMEGDKHKDSFQRSLSFDSLLCDDNMDIKIMNVVSLSNSLPTNKNESVTMTLDHTKNISTDSSPEFNETRSGGTLSNKERFIGESKDILSNEPISPEHLSYPDSTMNKGTVFKPKVIQQKNEIGDSYTRSTDEFVSNPFLKTSVSPPSVQDEGFSTKNENPMKDEIVDILSVDEDVPSAFTKSFKNNLRKDTTDFEELGDGVEKRVEYKSLSSNNRDTKQISPPNPKLYPRFSGPPRYQPSRPSSFVFSTHSAKNPSFSPNSIPQLPTYMQTTSLDSVTAERYNNKIRIANSILESYIKSHQTAPQKVFNKNEPPRAFPTKRYIAQYKTSPNYRENMTSPAGSKREGESLVAPRSPIESENTFLMELQRKHDEEYSTKTSQVRIRGI